jgi:hypothetical protein
MKTAQICLFVIFFILSRTHGQSVKSNVNPLFVRHVSIPFYKENAVIDSLINVAASGTYSARKYFVFRIIKIDSGYNFHLYQTERKKAGIILNLDQDTLSKVWGCFAYKSCTVFITGVNNDPFNFFIKTRCIKSFHFVWRKHIDEDFVQEQWNLFHIWYIYKKGRFYYSQLSND